MSSGERLQLKLQQLPKLPEQTITKQTSNVVSFGPATTESDPAGNQDSVEAYKNSMNEFMKEMQVMPNDYKPRGSDLSAAKKTMTSFLSGDEAEPSKPLIPAEQDSRLVN